MELIVLRNEKETGNLRTVLRTPYAVNFNMSILKMALNIKEDVISACLTCKYSIKIELQMIEFAIINKLIQFLKNVFINNKQPDLSQSHLKERGGTGGNDKGGFDTKNNLSSIQSEQIDTAMKDS
jgi:hypothetical protein